MSTEVSPPWDGFLRDIDNALTTSVELHCVGGFVVSMLYKAARPTADIDFLEARPSEQASHLLQLGGEGSTLHARHGVYLQKAAVSDCPDSYEQRLRPIFPGVHKKIRLFGLDPYDLALSKLQRNSIRDRQDVRYLARSIPLDPAVLQHRYQREMRPYLSRPQREDLTLTLWLEEFFPALPSPESPGV